MKKIILLLLSLNLLFAQNQKLSPIEPAKDFYPKLSTQNCDSGCLFDLLESKLYLSFLSEFNQQNADNLLNNIYIKLLNSITDFDKILQKQALIKLAIIVPEKTIKSYSNTIINASISYLLKQRAQIKVKVFRIGTEEEANIQNALDEIESQNYQYAIAGFTLKGANYLNSHLKNIKVFIPTVHKNNTQISHPNIYFGSIDYDAQIAALLKLSNDNIAVFSDNSALSNHLNEKISTQIQNPIRFYKIDGAKLDFKQLFQSNGDLNNASIFLNTPLVKTALISSQLRVNEISPYILLSTQINYNPTFLSITQTNDRKNFIIANSIFNEDQGLAYINSIFGQDINYNWVAYATSVGLDYFYTSFISQDSERIFDEKMQDSQLIYDIKFMRGLGYSFEEFKEFK
ncbi:hypothetical protein [Campylobacter sp. US33a]|uniref:hypothetical protein n=1 Tax=Campylobacter sp. US33a TaxID=2498120 RepID=UPI001068C033|nr:hypothetical protein [Campylobacter sp. US33a]TEY00965.1 hypothetical protein ELQ16_08260 [Campylobacter sp. US33a]